MSSLYHLVIIFMSVYFKQYRQEGTTLAYSIINSHSFESLELNFINICFMRVHVLCCFSNVCGIFLDYKIPNKTVSLYTI